MFKYILLISAFLIAASAGFFSVTGIGQLFIGAPISAMVMAAALELGKLVAVSFTYRYWTKIHGVMRTYFLVASVVLMAITSVGIYGYLSSAYASAATGIQAKQGQIALFDAKVTTTEQNILRLENRANALQSFRGQQETRLDALVGKRGMATQQQVIREADRQIADIQQQISTLSAQRDSLMVQKTSVTTSITTEGKIGTFYYISQSLGVPLDTIVKWFILAIVLVFDPLSVTLILAYNIIQRSERAKTTQVNTATSDSSLVPSFDTFISTSKTKGEPVAAFVNLPQSDDDTWVSPAEIKAKVDETFRRREGIEIT